MNNLARTQANKLAFYVVHINIKPYKTHCIATREFVKQEARAISEYWQNTFEVRDDGVIVRRDDTNNGGSGVLVATIGNLDALGIGDTTTVTTTETQTRSRSWERAQRLWQSAVDSYMAGGYGDPRIRNYADNVIGEPNYQRDAWINGVDTVLRGFVANIPSEPEAQGPEEDPSKPDIYSAGELTAELNRVIDVAVGGVRVEEKLRFGAELEKALAEYLNENGSNGSLDKWYATAGEGPIDVSWTVSIKEEGAYALHIQGLPSWGFGNATLSVSGNTIDIVRDVSGYRGQEPLVLAQGHYSISMNGITVPTNAGVEDGRFMLAKVDDLAPTVEAQFETSFVADYPTALSEDSQFNVYDLEGAHEINGVTALAQHFAPILHFHKDEQYRPVSAEDVWNQVGGDANLGREALDLSSVDESQLGSAIYSNVIKKDDNNLAISYFFYYLESNWGDYGGKNNHEGDWEGVTIFFIKSALEGETCGRWIPTKIAMAQHLDIANNLADHVNSDGGDYVNWGDSLMNIENSHPHLYVAPGSHATFAHSDQTIFGGKIDDHTSTDEGLDTFRYIVNMDRMGSESSPNWMKYQGLWGAGGSEILGSKAPSGPAFGNSSYLGENVSIHKNRWLNPWIWANGFNDVNDRDNE